MSMTRHRLLDNTYKKTAEGEQISVKSVARMYPSLTVYGHSTQSGTPSPENPVPIVSAGSVMTTGAQLLNINSGEISGSNIENITNTLTSGETYTYTNIDSPVPTIIGGRNASGDYIPFDNGVYASAGNGFTFVMPDNVAYLILGGSGGTIDKSMRFMLNAGSTALPWEPYTGGVPGVNPYEGEINVSVSDGGTQSQTLTLSTPGGLPGILVSSGGNYTDESGQQWVADVKDYGTGKYTQNVLILHAKDYLTNAYISSGNGTDEAECYAIRTLANTTIASDKLEDYKKTILCDHFTFSSSVFSGKILNTFGLHKPVGFATWNIYMMIDRNICPDLESFENFINENDPIFYIPVDNVNFFSIVTDIPAEEIAAYKALHTYSPTTTVSNDADAWMKVGYKTRKSLEVTT